MMIFIGGKRNRVEIPIEAGPRKRFEQEIIGVAPPDK
jgi:hypothetical protein